MEPAQSSTSTTDQLKERVGEGAQQIQEKASEAKVQARERLREQIDTRSTQTGEQFSSTASALRRTAQQLRGEQREPQARILEQIAEHSERFGRYLTESDGHRLLRDVERLARRRPWLVGSGGLVLGFLGARFMKASSSRRYEGDDSDRYAVGAREGRAAPELPSGSSLSARGGGESGDS
jgi:hypothetical protein